MAAVKKRAFEHRRTVMMGRSHGIHAEPIVLRAQARHLVRRAARAAGSGSSGRATTIAVGKISGAVGTFAHLPPAVEEHACRGLGLSPAPASSQVIQRDRHAEYFGALALLATSIEKFAVEIRHLQRTEVREVEEPFSAGQKGSSAMPHKRNPILSENLTGLARLLRGYALSALEDVPLWHERDISHSSVERVIGPDATVTLDFMLHRFAGLVEQTARLPGADARRTSQLLGGVVHSQRVLLELARRGVDRQAAYVIVQRNAMRMYEEGVDFRTALSQDRELRQADDARGDRSLLLARRPSAQRGRHLRAGVRSGLPRVLSVRGRLRLLTHHVEEGGRPARGQHPEAAKHAAGAELPVDEPQVANHVSIGDDTAHGSKGSSDRSRRFSEAIGGPDFKVRSSARLRSGSWLT